MAFRVPDDLAELDLKLSSVIEIIENRKAQKRISNRIEGLPAKKKSLTETLKGLIEREAEMLEDAAKLHKAAEEASA